LTPLDSSFSSSDIGNKEKHKDEELRKKVFETISMNIRTPESSTNVKINVQCSDKEDMRYVGILGGYQKVFSWSYEDLRGFDPGLVQHIMKPARQKKELVNSALEAPFQKELENFLKAGIIFQSTLDGFPIGYLLQRPQIILEPAFIFAPLVRLL
jgi:hypothetical protein